MAQTTHKGAFFDSTGRTITPAAFFALKAALMRKQIGRWAAYRYALKHGSTARLFRIACQLQAAQVIVTTGAGGAA